MSTLAEGGRITAALVEEEIQRLRANWTHRLASSSDEAPLIEYLGAEAVEAIDHFDRTQVANVIRVCRQSRSLSAAGRSLFQASRLAKARPNDADRLRKYLQRFGLTWEEVHRPTLF